MDVPEKSLCYGEIGLVVDQDAQLPLIELERLRDAVGERLPSSARLHFRFVPRQLPHASMDPSQPQRLERGTVLLEVQGATLPEASAALESAASGLGVKTRLLRRD
jgi:ribosomal protein L16/L10AE